MLLCTVLTFALCADPNVSATLTVGDLTVPIVWSRAHIRSCMDVGQGSTADGNGFTRIETGWGSQQTGQSGSEFTGRVTERITSVRIELTALSWDHMTKADIEAIHRLYRAALWHEIGHVRTAAASLAAANEHGDFSATTPLEYQQIATQIGNADFARFGADQENYDRLVEHGLRQSSVPPPLGGPNTIVDCGER